MPEDDTESAFRFVNYDGTRLSSNPTVRRLIRRQAMRGVAAIRKERGNYGKINMRQLPICLCNGIFGVSPAYNDYDKIHDTCTTRHQNKSSKDSDGSSQGQPQDHNFRPYSLSTVIAPTLTVGPAEAETFSILISLTPVTGLRLGITERCHLSAASKQFRNLPSTTHLGGRKLLYYIPSRYGQVSCLTHATDCVVAKLRQMIRHPECREQVENTIALRHYAKALGALQIALEHESQWKEPETLCATVLLGIFEQLEGKSKASSWICHASGAARLIQARGADRFNSEFEMALLLANIGPTVMDAYLGNRASFLAEEQWRRVMCDAISSDESLMGQKDNAVELWSHLVHGPKLFKETTDFILSSGVRDDVVGNRLIRRLDGDRNGLLGWIAAAQERAGWDSQCSAQSPYSMLLPWPAAECGNLNSQQVTDLALWGTCYMCLILKSRLLYALAPSRYKALEHECQTLAAGITSLSKVWNLSGGRPAIESLFISQSDWIAMGVILTKVSWSEDAEREGPIASWKFKAWCDAIQRSPCSNQ